MGAFVDRVGQRYGKLVVVGREQSKGRVRWVCRCDCGNTKAVLGESLAAKRTFSCGCLHREILTKQNHRHGLSARGKLASEFRIFNNMKQRCGNPENPGYHNYGGRGIECRFGSAVELIDAIGKRPSRRHSVDRIDVNGHYEKGNVRWATPRQQANNLRKNRLVTAFGETMSLPDMARKHGIGVKCLTTRLNKGMGHEEAVSKPVCDQSYLITVGGVTNNLAFFSREFQINFSTLRKRLRRGVTAEEAVKTPINLKFRRRQNGRSN